MLKLCWKKYVSDKFSEPTFVFKILHHYSLLFRNPESCFSHEHNSVLEFSRSTYMFRIDTLCVECQTGKKDILDFFINTKLLWNKIHKHQCWTFQLRLRPQQWPHTELYREMKTVPLNVWVADVVLWSEPLNLATRSVVTSWEVIYYHGSSVYSSWKWACYLPLRIKWTVFSIVKLL